MGRKTATIVGQGYVGLPLAQAATRAGWSVNGLEIDGHRVAALNGGVSHVDDLSNADIDEMLALGYRATTEANVVLDSNVVIICVPTPLGEGGSPDLRAVKSASQMVGPYVQPGSIVILESTTYPGTTEKIVQPILEHASGLKAGVDFHLAYSPERVDPGSKQFGITNTPKLVGGITERCTTQGINFYGSFIESPIAIDGPREAEAAKLLENTFRHVNIALVNEMAKFCHELDIDIWEVIRGAATKPFGFMKFTPGPGVGGHCIPIDPNYLSYEVRNQLGYPFRFVELAQEINNSMPRYVVDRTVSLLNKDRKPLNGSIVLLLGVTYKQDIADQRESPAVAIAELLTAKGANVRYHDPLVQTWTAAGQQLERVDNLQEAAADADIVVVLQAHRSYELERIAKSAKLLFDTRGSAPAPAHRL